MYIHTSPAESFSFYCETELHQGPNKEGRPTNNSFAPSEFLKRAELNNIYPLTFGVLVTATPKHLRIIASKSNQRPACSLYLRITSNPLCPYASRPHNLQIISSKNHYTRLK